MTLQAVQNLAILDGTAVTFAAVAATDTITPNLGYRYVLIVVNGNASSDTVTITPSGTDPFGRTLAAKTVSVANGTTKYIYLAQQQLLADGTTGLITITHSVTSSVTCAVVAIPN
jgi:hypothetical protein